MILLPPRWTNMFKPLITPTLKPGSLPNCDTGTNVNVEGVTAAKLVCGITNSEPLVKTVKLPPVDLRFTISFIWSVSSVASKASASSSEPRSKSKYTPILETHTVCGLCVVPPKSKLPLWNVTGLG